MTGCAQVELEGGAFPSAQHFYLGIGPLMHKSNAETVSYVDGILNSSMGEGFSQVVQKLAACEGLLMASAEQWAFF